MHDPYRYVLAKKHIGIICKNEPILHLGSFFFLQTIRKQNFGRKEAKILQFLFEIGPHFREIESSMQKRSI